MAKLKKHIREAASKPLENYGLYSPFFKRPTHQQSDLFFTKRYMNLIEQELWG